MTQADIISTSLTINSTETSDRLDVYLATHACNMTRSRAQRLIRDGLVSVNDTPCKPGQPVHVGDSIHIRLPVEPGPPVAEPLPLCVLYEDKDMVVLDKPPGMVVHPAPGHYHHTLVNALLDRYPDIRCGEAMRPGIVHRLDKDTSGIMVIARHVEAREWLSAQFKAGSVGKVYLALVTGRLEQDGLIDAPIGRHPVHRKRMAVTSTGKHALTYYSPIEHFDGFTLVEARPVTGRTHQIRVHLAAMGHPIAGDRTYGPRTAWRKLEPGLQRHFLHAATLKLKPLHSDLDVVFTSPLPCDLTTVVCQLRGQPLP